MMYEDEYNDEFEDEVQFFASRLDEDSVEEYDYDEDEWPAVCFGCGSPVDVCRCFGG